MTSIAQTILADVPRHYAPRGLVLYETEVLAALTAAMDPALSERAGEVVPKLRGVCTCNIDSSPCMAEDDCRDAIDAADLITALLARIAAMEVQIKGLRAERDTVLGMYMRSSEEGFRQKAHAEAAETALAAMTKERDYADGTNEVLRGENQRLETALAAERSKVAKLVEALESIANDVDLMATGRTSLLGKMGRTARAALTTEASQ